MSDRAEAWERLVDLAAAVATRFPSTVKAISAVPYEDSIGREGVHFVVTLLDRTADYAWQQDLRPIEEALAEALLAAEIERIPYTDYQLESDASTLRDESSAL